METVIEGRGMIVMLYNYITDSGRFFRQNQQLIYENIIKKHTNKCKCNGEVDTYYIVSGHKIPITRASKI